MDYKISSIYKLNKALYGLKQFPKVQYNTLVIFFKELRFEFLDFDTSIFFRNNTIIVIYINNLLIVRVSILKINKIKDNFKSYFQISDLGFYHFYLNIEITRDRKNRIFRFD